MPDTSSECNEPTLPEFVALARKAQVPWAALSIAERNHRFRTLIPSILAKADDVTHSIQSESGKLKIESLAELLTLPDLLDYWTHHTESLLEPTDVELDPIAFPGKSGRTERTPHGVIALVCTSSEPFAVPLRHLIPALLTGNAVLFKPGATNIESANLLCYFFQDILPKHLLTVLTKEPDHAQLVDAGVDAVVFCGSPSEGKALAMACAERFIPCSLQIGGKDAAIVLADANIERTARGIVWGAFSNAGLASTSIQRVYVVRSVAEKLIQRIVEITQSLRPKVDVGPLATQAQADAAAEHLNEAIERGADVLTGGAPEPDQCFFPPTVLKLKEESVRLLKEQCPGPLLPILIVDDPEQAIEHANDSPYGLTVSLWTRGTKKAVNLARRLQAGVVTINNHGVTPTLPMVPLSGRGRSGQGVSNSPFSLDGYTRPRFILTDRRRFPREPWWYPYDDTLEGVAKQMIRMRGGAGFLGRLGAFFRLLLLWPKRLFGK